MVLTPYAPFRPFLAVAPALALIFAPAGVLPQGKAARPPADAPYNTKIQCAAFNVFKANPTGDEPFQYSTEAARAEMWLDLALAEKPDKEAELLSGFEAHVITLATEVREAIRKDGEAGFYRAYNQYETICAPYGG
jgi:hypothetical protein